MPPAPTVPDELMPATRSVPFRGSWARIEKVIAVQLALPFGLVGLGLRIEQADQFVFYGIGEEVIPQPIKMTGAVDEVLLHILTVGQRRFRLSVVIHQGLVEVYVVESLLLEVVHDLLVVSRSTLLQGAAVG